MKIWDFGIFPKESIFCYKKNSHFDKISRNHFFRWSIQIIPKTSHLLYKKVAATELPFFLSFFMKNESF